MSAVRRMKIATCSSLQATVESKFDPEETVGDGDGTFPDT